MAESSKNNGQRSWRALPANTIFGVFDKEENVKVAVDALQQAGFDLDRVRVWRSEADAQKVDPNSPGQGLFSELASLLQQVGDTSTFREDLAAQIRDGRVVIAASFESDAERSMAERNFADHGAVAVAFTDNWTLTVLS